MISAAFLLALVGSGSSQTCWEAYQPTDPNNYPVMLNRCTGESWMLVRHSMEDGKGKVTSEIYTWDKIGFGPAANSFPVRPDNK